MLTRVEHKFCHFFMRQESWCTATPMQLGNRNFFLSTHSCRHHRHFFGYILNILGATAMIFGDDLVTATVVTNVWAEG